MNRRELNLFQSKRHLKSSIIIILLIPVLSGCSATYIESLYQLTPQQQKEREGTFKDITLGIDVEVEEHQQGFIDALFETDIFKRVGFLKSFDSPPDLVLTSLKYDFGFSDEDDPMEDLGNYIITLGLNPVEIKMEHKSKFTIKSPSGGDEVSLQTHTLSISKHGWLAPFYLFRSRKADYNLELKDAFYAKEKELKALVQHNN